MDATPSVILAGKTYAVPLLVPKQNREVIPALLKLAPLLRVEGGFIQHHYAEVVDIVATVIYWGAIWPNDKKALLDSVSEMPVTLKEMMEAVNIIRVQTGLFVKAQEGATPGESETATSELPK